MVKVRLEHLDRLAHLLNKNGYYFRRHFNEFLIANSEFKCVLLVNLDGSVDVYIPRSPSEGEEDFTNLLAIVKLIFPVIRVKKTGAF